MMTSSLSVFSVTMCRRCSTIWNSWDILLIHISTNNNWRCQGKVGTSPPTPASGGSSNVRKTYKCAPCDFENTNTAHHYGIKLRFAFKMYEETICKLSPNWICSVIIPTLIWENKAWSSSWSVSVSGISVFVEDAALFIKHWLSTMLIWKRPSSTGSSKSLQGDCQCQGECGDYGWHTVCRSTCRPGSQETVEPGAGEHGGRPRRHLGRPDHARHHNHWLQKLLESEQIIKVNTSRSNIVQHKWSQIENIG